MNAKCVKPFEHYGFKPGKRYGYEYNFFRGIYTVYINNLCVYLSRDEFTLHFKK